MLVMYDGKPSKAKTLDSRRPRAIDSTATTAVAVFHSAACADLQGHGLTAEVGAVFVTGPPLIPTVVRRRQMLKVGIGKLRPMHLKFI